MLIKLFRVVTWVITMCSSLLHVSIIRESWQNNNARNLPIPRPTFRFFVRQIADERFSANTSVRSTWSGRTVGLTGQQTAADTATGILCNVSFPNRLVYLYMRTPMYNVRLLHRRATIAYFLLPYHVYREQRHLTTNSCGFLSDSSVRWHGVNIITDISCTMHIVIHDVYIYSIHTYPCVRTHARVGTTRAHIHLDAARTQYFITILARRIIIEVWDDRSY